MVALRRNCAPSSPFFIRFSEVINRSLINRRPQRAIKKELYYANKVTEWTQFINHWHFTFSTFLWPPVILAFVGNVLQWNGVQWKGKQRLRVLTDPWCVTSSSLSSQTVLLHQPLKMLTFYFHTPASIHSLLPLLKWKEVSSVRVGCYSNQTPDFNECCFSSLWWIDGSWIK